MASVAGGIRPAGVRRVVVGFDGSESARAALAWATAEARLHDAALEVWTVLEPPPHGTSGATADDSPALAELRRAATELSDGAADLRIGHGAAAALLCGVCDPSDVLVVGSRGRSPFADLVLGSVSRACLHHAPCSVTVVRPASQRARVRGRVVVGIDTSSHARRALRVAAREAELRGAALQVVHVVHWDHLGVEVAVPTTEQLLSWGRDLVRSELAAAGVDTPSLVVHGSPGDVLVRRSGGADLLVLGSRGHNPLAAMTLGSTTDHCAHHAACPVMVVRPGTEGPDEPGAGRPDPR